MIKLDRIKIFALGYDHKTDDYKLSAGVTDFQREDTVFQIYSLASNSWKLGPTVPYSISYTARWHEVVVNGYHHWLAIAQRKFFILSFDIINESFKEMQPPKELLGKNLEDDRIIPGVLEGCLYILDSSYTNGVKINVEVWEMLDYGVHESWTRRYIITHESIIWRRNLIYSYVVVFWEW
ncbi:F-box/kelch-repeat protein At3g06240-like [Papaver somniferum]|uniref:F-box/kelch-repeat protein At3g06240-like n=1 Tax=Papaver somniferum TaxID=3469 RepID=UPI000E6FDC76|nr:F-box/kelch-repeat protein At3g06240-like [Papaver somniferum]